MTTKSTKKKSLKELYFFTVALVAAMITIIGIINFGNTILSTYVFPIDNTDYYYEPFMAEDMNCYLNEVGTKTCTRLTKEEELIREAKQQEQSEKRVRNERNRSYSFSLMMILVGLPLWSSHYYLGKKTNKS